MDTIQATTPTPKNAAYWNGTNGAHPAPNILTWDDYLAEPTVWERYDIIEGVRRFMSSPILRHQRIVGHINRRLQRHEETTRSGLAISSPYDVVIRRTPKIQSRQPDCLYVTNDRLARQPNHMDAGYLAVTPNLIVEVLSDSDRKSVVSAKLADYFSIGVDEAWIVRPDDATIAVLTRGLADYDEAARYDVTQTLVSVALPGLSAPVADLLKP